MIVTARTFTSAAEMLASAAAVHDRCFKPKVKPAGKPASGVKPLEAELGEAEPGEIGPVEAQSVGAQSVGSKSVGAKSGEAASVEVGPAGAEPTGAEPAGAEPTGAKPIGAEPTGAKPAEAKSAGAKPAGAKPAGAKRAEAPSSAGQSHMAFGGAASPFAPAGVRGEKGGVATSLTLSIPYAIALPSSEIGPVGADPSNPVPFMADGLPEWQSRPTHFDAHVIASVHILELIASGEIVIMRRQQQPGRRRSVPEIVLEVLADFPGITIEDLKSPRRARKFTVPRQLALYEVYRQRKDMSFPAIGRWFGGRDHTTVIHAVRKVEAQMAETGRDDAGRGEA